MDEQRRFRPEDEEPPSEGVRIIGPEEAAEAEGRPDVAPRRGEGEPRFGDRPAEPDEHPRPSLRFPLDSSSDPSRIERPPVDPAPGPVTGPVELPHWTEPATGEVPAVLAGDRGGLLDDENDLEAWSSFATSTPRWRDADDDWDDGDYVADLIEHTGESRLGALAEHDDDDDGFADLDERAEERTGRRRREDRWSSADELDWADEDDEWTERVEPVDQADEQDDAYDEAFEDEPVDARRDDRDDGFDDDYDDRFEDEPVDDRRAERDEGFDDEDGEPTRGIVIDPPPEEPEEYEPTRVVEIDDLAGDDDAPLDTGELAEIEADDERLRSAADDPDEHEDDFDDSYEDGYDDDYEADDYEDDHRDRGGVGGFASRFRPVEDGGGERDMATAVGVGVGLAVLAIVAMLISPALMVALVTAILGLAALEWFSVLDNAEWESAGLLGIGACVAFPLAIYWRGPVYYPMLMFIVFAAILAWFLVGAGGRDPRVLEGSMSTLFGVVWIGGFGSSAAGILALPDGRSLLLVAILATVAYDVGGLFIGRYLGHRRLSAASPNKTLEGLVGGMVLAFAITIVTVGIASLGPWTGFSAVLLLGLGSACAAPLGDLSQSLLKRDLGIKDMGSILPGHGGILDRFDSLLFVLPTVFWLTVSIGMS